MEKKICFFFASQKGGVGKTFLAMSLVEHLRQESNQSEVVVIDADHLNRSLCRRYALKDASGAVLPNSKQDVFTGVIALEESVTGTRSLFLQALKTEADYAVVDFAAAAEHDIKAMFPNDQSMDSAFKRLGYEIVVVLPFDEQPDSTQAAEKIVNFFGKGVTYVLVKNPKRSDSRAEMTRRFEEISRLFANNAIGVSGHTMSKQGLALFSRCSNLSFKELVGFGKRSVADEDQLDADWVQDFLDQQSEMWDQLIGQVNRMIDERCEEAVA